ncbi:MAG: DUF423 domain-containing protein [Rhodospirillales bacterium]|nr:DUF423 domain-containing protein [Rhodospirillales bacterium]MDE2576674.1 DUF423 domain-containing protein [Rhodospirillales bacterium]
MTKTWISLGALAGLLSVAFAAAAAHLLPRLLDPAGQQMVRDGIQIQGWHAAALLFTGLWAPRGGRLADLAGAAFSLGTLLFCGAVYALALGGLRLPAIAPTGGVLLMIGWALLALSAWRAR